MKRNLKRRAYGRNIKNGLMAQSPVDKLKSIKVRGMTGVKLKALSSDSYITNDTDGDSQQGFSDYLGQASDLQATVENLNTYKGGLPHPSSVGGFAHTVAAGETDVIYAFNIYNDDMTAAPVLDGSDSFNGMLEIRSMYLMNNTGATCTYDFYLSMLTGDGIDNSSSIIPLSLSGTLAAGAIFSVDMGATFGGPLLMQSNRVTIIIRQASGTGTPTLNLLYGVVAYGGGYGG